jgi:hypothetical protein
VEIGRDVEDLVRRFHLVARGRKVLSYFTGEDISSFHFTDSSLTFCLYLIKSLYIKYLNRSQSFEYTEAVLNIHNPRG